MKNLIEKYKAPTPVKWRKVGDAILIGTTSLSAMMMGSPFAETTVSYIIFALNVIGVAGKILTNLASEDEPAVQ